MTSWSQRAEIRGRLCQVERTAGTKASGRHELCLFQEQEGLGVTEVGWVTRAVVPRCELCCKMPLGAECGKGGCWEVY